MEWQHGLSLSSVQSEKLKTLGADVEDADWRAITELEDDLARLAGATDQDQDMMTRVKLNVAVRARGVALPAIRDFLEASDAWLDEVLESAKNRRGGYETETSDSLRSVVLEWADIVRGEEPTDE